MIKLLLACFLLLPLLGCDSTEAPAFDLQFAAPQEGEVYVAGSSIRVDVEIHSVLDVRTADIVVLMADGDTRVEHTYRNVSIKQGPAITEFRIDTTLTLPHLPVDATVQHLQVITPGGTGNRVGFLRLIP